MGTASTTAEMNVPARTAWDVLADFGGILKWSPGSEGATIECVGEGVGMVRILFLPAFGTAHERLDVLDHDTMTLVLTITEGLPFDMKEYQATISVAPIDDDHCACTWTGNYVGPDGVDDGITSASLEGAYEGMFDGLRGHLGG